MPRRAPLSTWSRGGNPGAVGAPQVRTVTLAEGSRPTGTLACGRFGSARSSGPSSSSTARRTAPRTRTRSEAARSASMCCSNSRRRLSTSRMWSTSDTSAPRTRRASRTTSGCCRISLMSSIVSSSKPRPPPLCRDGIHPRCRSGSVPGLGLGAALLARSRAHPGSSAALESLPAREGIVLRPRRITLRARCAEDRCSVLAVAAIVSAANTKIKQIGPRLDVENYTRRPPAILTDLDQVIGGGLDIHPEAVALGIDGLARKDRGQGRRRDLLDDEGRRDEAVAVEDDEQVVQPGHEQTFQVVGLYGARPALTLLHRGGIDDEVKHAAGGVGEEFGKIAAVGDDADVGGMVKDLEGDRGRRHERGAGAIIARAARAVLE